MSAIESDPKDSELAVSPRRLAARAEFMRFVCRYPALGLRLAGALGIIGENGLAQKIAYATSQTGNVVRVRVPAYIRPFSSFLMRTRDSCAGRDQIAESLWGRGWSAFERPLPDVFAALVRNTTCAVIDVGANSGFYTLLGATVAPRARVLAFEPLKPIADLLESNLRLNGLLSNVVVRRVAVGAGEGTATLHVPPQSFGLVETSASLNPHFKETIADSHDVDIVTLDFAVKDLDLPVDVVKVDVESLEYEVLKGAERLLAEQRPHVFCEILHRDAVDKLEKFRSATGYLAVTLRPEVLVVQEAVLIDPEAPNQVLVHASRLREFSSRVAAVGLTVLS